MTDDRKLSAYVDPHLTDSEAARQWQAIDDRLGREGASRTARPIRFRGTMAFALGAAAVALVVVAGALFTASHQTPVASAWDGAVLDSGGDRMSVSLGDGSRIELERASRVLVHEGSTRSVLLEMPRGGAHFDVPHVEGRSFEVLTEGVRVRVVGTRFSVITTDVPGGHLVTVSVERGAVVAGPESGGEPVRIGEGETWSTVRPMAPAVQPAAKAPAMPPPLEPAAKAEPSHAVAAEGEPPVVGRTAPEAAARVTARAAVEITAQELFEKANAARQGGDARGAATAYDSLLRHYPSDARAGLAAFELGRLKMDQLGDLPGAVAALGRAVTLAPGPGFREDALARLVRAYDTLGNSQGCGAAQKQYLGSYPNGVHAAAVRKACGGAP
jgi:transmembrane sensor